MDVRFTDEQNLLRQSAHDFLAKECPMTFVREMMDDARGFTDGFWNKVVELGWTGLIFDEALGGTGLGLVDLCVLMEEQGRALMPGPFFSSVAVGGIAVALGASPQQKRDLVSRIADGSMRVTLAQLEDNGSWGSDGIGLVATKDGNGFRLSGAKHFVPDAHTADALIVAARSDTAAGISLLLVDTTLPGVEIEPLAYIDATRKMSVVHLRDVVVGSDALLAHDGEGLALLERVHDFAKIALCAEMIGGARAVLDLSVEYAKTREQFGSPIGKFQAIQHKCADMLVLVESAKSAAYYAAWTIDNDEPDAHVSACMAKAYCAEAYSRVAGDGIQIHGGMGFTWDADLHLYFKRAKASELAFGSPVCNRELAAAVLLDSPTA